MLNVRIICTKTARYDDSMSVAIRYTEHRDVNVDRKTISWYIWLSEIFIRDCRRVNQQINW